MGSWYGDWRIYQILYSSAQHTSSWYFWDDGSPLCFNEDVVLVALFHGRGLYQHFQKDHTPALH